MTLITMIKYINRIYNEERSLMVKYFHFHYRNKAIGYIKIENRFL